MRIIVVWIALVASLGIARAETFESIAETANPVKRLDDVVWAFVGACDKGDDVQQRQCRLVRDKRAAQLVGAFLLVDADSSALELAKWSRQKKSTGVTVSSCIRCAGIDVEGKHYFLTGGQPRFEGQKLRTTVLHDSSKTFNDEASATAFAKGLDNAHVQLIVKVPASPKWSTGGKLGMAFEVVAWRVAQACDGAIVASSPASGPMDPDKSKCGGAAVVSDPANTGSVPEKLPEALTGAMIKAAMQPVLDAANACFQRYKVTGKAKLVMQVAADGSVLEYTQEGELVGTPTATCIDTAAKKVTFPRTQKPKTKVGFPIVLR